ncbi:MAG: hypothetical protein K6C38_00780 [Saccharofermentans sp.]|nr:hypothetical protein [Saccharofermentans sp.]
MSKNTEKYLQVSVKAIKGIYADLESVAKDIIDYQKYAYDLNSNGTYTKAYKDEKLKEDANKKSSHIALTLDTIRAGYEDLKEATRELNASGDVFEDAKLMPAITTAGSLKSDDIDAAELIIKQFAGNFPALLLIAGNINVITLKELFYNSFLTDERLEETVSFHENYLEQMTDINLKGDLYGVGTRIYAYKPELDKLAALYGARIDEGDYPLMTALFNVVDEKNMRVAMGLDKSI